MASSKKAVLQLLAGLLSLLVMTLLYSRHVARITNKIQSTVPEMMSSKYTPRFSAPELPTTYSPSVYFRDIFDPSTVPNVPMGTDNITDKDKYFIYRCDESTMRVCGGWADRIKGAMFAYMVANLTGRSFKMEILSASCDIHRFIVPNQINWYLPESFHTKVEVGPNVSMLNVVDNISFLTRLNHDFLALPQMRTRYLYFKVNREPFRYFRNFTHYQSQLAWMKNLKYPDIFNTVYRRLFKPSTYLLNKVNTFLKDNLQPNTKLVCIHLRMGINPAIHDVEKKLFTKKEHLPIAWDFLHNVTKHGNTKIFMMSDSQPTIDEAKHLNFSEKFFFYSGKIVHVDHARNVPVEERCQGYESVIFEQLVLMHCDVLVITRGSGISRTAAYVRGTDDNLYCLFRTGELIPCRRTDL